MWFKFLGNLSPVAREYAERAAVVMYFGCFLHFTSTRCVGVTMCHGPSMFPQFNPVGDIVLKEHVTQSLGHVQRGDVVVAQSPLDPRQTVIKRVCGVEGDYVTYWPQDAYGAKEKHIRVPKGHLWLQGDNVRNSRDSRDYGPVPQALLRGRVFFKIWPLTEAGWIGRSMPDTKLP
eukprot:jgi/Mesvir1/18733/Mv01246-RA.1